MFPNYYSKKNNDFFIQTGDTLVCGNEIHPVINGIPRFVGSGSYASLFGDQWKRYKKTQLDSYTGTPISLSRLDRCLGPLNATISGKLVLETGCGAGRFTELLLQKGAKLISSDISTAVGVNRENFPFSENHRIIQADINDMPFESESFDIVICMGVIQHTPDPEETIRNLYSLVKKGGWLVIDHYTLVKSYLFRLAPFFRMYLKRKKPEYTIPYVERMVKRMLPWHKKFRKSKILSVLLNRFSPVVTYYRVFPDLNDELQEQWAMLDTHDSLTDWYKHFRSVKSIRKTLSGFGAKDIWCEWGGNGVEARCKKP
ncbi:MAG: class I SAM-dependent methyltransferase [Chitinophagaceae bacterium]